MDKKVIAFADVFHRLAVKLNISTDFVPDEKELSSDLDDQDPIPSPEMSGIQLKVKEFEHQTFYASIKDAHRSFCIEIINVVKWLLPRHPKHIQIKNLLGGIAKLSNEILRRINDDKTDGVNALGSELLVLTNQLVTYSSKSFDVDLRRVANAAQRFIYVLLNKFSILETTSLDEAM